MTKRVPYIGILTAFGVLFSFQFLTWGVNPFAALITWAICIGLTFLGEFLGSKLRFKYGANVGAAIPAVLFIVIAEVLTAIHRSYFSFDFTFRASRLAFEVPAICALLANVGSIVTEKLLFLREHHGVLPPENLSIRGFLPMLITGGAGAFVDAAIVYSMFIFATTELPAFAIYLNSLARIVCLAALAFAVGVWLDRILGKKFIGFSLVAVAGAYRLIVNLSQLKKVKTSIEYSMLHGGAVPFWRFQAVVWAVLLIVSAVFVYRNFRKRSG